ncbi:MAG: thioredoxin [Bacteroidota bacterium]|nr:thioredoxin [Bacteroidota bacterium]
MSENLTKQTFQNKIFDYEKNKEWKYNGELPSVVDFWAPLCVPCRIIGPVIDELSKEYDGKVNFYKINTEEEQELASVFGIQSIPSLLFIPKDRQPMMAVGALPKDTLKNIINKELLSINPQDDHHHHEHEEHHHN